MIPAFDGDAAIEDVEQHRRRIARLIEIPRRNERRNPSSWTSGERKEPFRMLREQIERDARLAARVIHARSRDQRGKVAVSLPRLGEQYEMVGLPRWFVVCASPRCARLSAF